jgi:hypothetical protein
MRVRFVKSEIKKYFKDDEDSDMEDVYHRAREYFQNTEWIVEGSFEEVEQILFRHIWAPYDQGDLLLRRWLNSNLAIIVG